MRNDRSTPTALRGAATPPAAESGWAPAHWRARAGAAALALVLAVAVFWTVSGVWRFGAPKRPAFKPTPVEVSLVPAVPSPAVAPAPAGAALPASAPRR